MTERRLMKDADKIVLTDGSLTTLHSHPGGGGGLVDKADMVTSDGNAEAIVTFNTPYGSLDYFIQLTAGESADAVICNMKSGTKTVSGFTIITLDDGGKVEANVDVYWCTGPYSNP